jgi:hypothetical protein
LEPSQAGQPLRIGEARQFWSFRPLLASDLPRPQHPAWVRGRVDAHIFEALELRGFSPSPQADRRTLIRRATFDLIGLPPSPEEIDAFVQDESPDAYPRMIDRLLASPHYGERWGRYWLDLVRYCDVPESWAQTQAQAWLYRDWVVRALNDDLGYDQFVRRQLAADQMPDCPPSEIAALGFLGLSPSYWKELKLAPDVIQAVVAEEWEERIDAVSSVLLGLTVACARCHDHKFDPITQLDYYALAGIFASIRQTPRPLLPAADAERVLTALREIQQIDAEVKKLEEEIKKLEAEAKKQTAAAGDSLAEPSDIAHGISALKQQVETARTRSEELRRSTPHIDEPMAYAVEDASLAVLPDGPHRTRLDYQTGASQDVAVQFRGNPAKPGAVVPRRFLAALSPGEPRRFTQGSGRLGLGEAIFHEAPALAARVIVNRVWRHHVGRGLVETPSNFGAQGARPTHAHLLDDLAARFIQSGWSLKWLHREIMLSATYQQTSLASEPLVAADPDNRLLGRMNRRRIEVEAWRDAMLAASGSLDCRIGGAPLELSDLNHVRRTLYGTVRRRELNDMLRLYDFPDPTAHCPERIDTTTPLQQLYTLNSDFIGRQAATLAARVAAEYPGDMASQVHRAYALLFGRTPTERELTLARNFLEVSGGEPAQPDQWQQYAEVLLASNELLFID